MHAKKATVAVLSAPTTSQLSVALQLATRTLRSAKTINNTTRMIIFGSGLSDPSADAVAHAKLTARIAMDGLSDQLGELVKNVDIVVGANDLALLRLVPSRHFGEVCRPPTCANALCPVPPASAEIERRQVYETIECLLRPPPIEYKSTDDLPFEWKEYVADMASFAWAKDLWKQSLLEVDKMPNSDIVPSPYDVLSLCMFFKVASIAIKTTEMTMNFLRRVVTAVDGASELGLLGVFPENGTAPRVVEFIEPYLRGDDYPWQLTVKGKRAADAARTVMERTFKHCERVASILRKANIAMWIQDDFGPIDGRATESVLVVSSGQNGELAHILANRIPIGARAIAGRFTVQTTTPTDEWVPELNRQFQELIATILDDEPVKLETATIRSRLASYIAMSSRHLQTSDASASAFQSTFKNVITTYPVGAAAHIVHELTIRPDFITIGSTSAQIALQRGTSISCTFATFCPTMRSTLSTPPFSTALLATLDLQNSQETIDAIAAEIDTPTTPLGLFNGTIGGVVELDGVQARVVTWRKNGDGHDSIVTFIPSGYIDVAFSDYATGSRGLDANELHPHTPVPFLASDTILTVLQSNVIPNTNELAYRLPRPGRLPLLSADEPMLYEAIANAVQTGQTRGRTIPLPGTLGGFRSILVRESTNDRLAGLKIAFARRIARGTPIAVLISANSSFEKVAY